MKRKLFGIPVAVVILAVAIPLVAFAAYRVLTFQGTITVAESVTTTAPLTWTATLYPGSSDVHSIILQNAGPTPVDVALGASVAPSGQGVSVSLSSATLTIPSTGQKQATFTVTTLASTSVTPGSYTVTATVDR